MRWVAMAMMVAGCNCEFRGDCKVKEGDDPGPVVVGDAELSCNVGPDTTEGTESIWDRCVHADISVVDESTAGGETTSGPDPDAIEATEAEWDIAWTVTQTYEDPDAGPVVDVQEFTGAALIGVYPFGYEESTTTDALPVDISESTYAAHIEATSLLTDGEFVEQDFFFGFDSFADPSGFRDVWVSGSAISGTSSGGTCTLKVQFTGGCFSSSGFNYEVFLNGASQFTYTSGSLKPVASAGGSAVSGLSSANRRITGSFSVVEDANATYFVEGVKTVASSAAVNLRTCYNVTCGSTVTATKAICP